MKKIIQTNYNGLDSLHIINAPLPQLTPLSALIQTAYIPILPFDWKTEFGQLKKIRPIQLPITIGYGFSGVVTAVGALRHKSLIGQRVIGMQPSGSATTIINSQLPPLLFKVPNNVSLSAATTLIGGADAALHVTHIAQITSTDTVLITGSAGGIGSYLIQILKLMGATVIALTSTANTTFVEKLHPDYIVNYQKDLSGQLNNIQVPNKIIDTVGHLELLDQLTQSYNTLNIISLALTNYVPAKSMQKFRFTNGHIPFNEYDMLLNWLSNGQIIAHIQEIFPYTDVKLAQNISIKSHTHGRNLLKF